MMKKQCQNPNKLEINKLWKSIRLTAEGYITKVKKYKGIVKALNKK